MKKTPQRMCVSCRLRKDKKDLLRIVLQNDGTAIYDPSGKISGRGSYLCPDEKCIKTELKAHRLSKGLRHMLSEDELSEIARSILEQFVLSNEETTGE